MIEIQPIERVDMAQRIDQIRRRIAAIEEKIGIGTGDFQATLEREIARQASMNPVQPTQAVADVQKIPGTTQPVNENDAVNSAKVAEALRNAEKNNLPAANNSAPVEPSQNPSQQVPPKIERFNIPDVELEEPNREDKIFADNYVADDTEITSTEDLIMQTAYEYGVDPQLVKAIAIAESDMNQDEISPVGAIGVMQLMPETAQALGVNPYDKGENIVGGTRYIRQMLETFDGNVPLAVAAYNAGPNAVKRYGGIPPYTETQNYVGRVMDMYQ